MPIWIPRLGGPPGAPVYRRIVQAISDDIAAGRLSAGDRLPPHRDLTDRLEVARGTVAKAYAEAGKLGLLRSGVGSGTFVLAPDSGGRPYSTLLEPPVIWSDLTTNYPLADIDPDPADALRELSVRPDRMALMRYQSNLGMRRHRLAGVGWARRLGVETELDGVIICSGAQHALFVTLAHLTEPGDAVLVEEWSYPGLHGIAETLRLRLVPVRMDREGIDPGSLDHACRTQRARALFCMPTVHNPTGAVLSAARRARVAEIARQHDLRIIEDAAHRLLAADPPPPLHHFAPERTYFIASTSKILGAGLRVAFLVAPPAEIRALSRHVWATQWMVSPLGAEVVTIWLEQGVADRTLRRKRREAARRQGLARRILAGHDIQAHPSALHLWLKVPRPQQAEQVVAEAGRQNIGVTPSSAFWMRAPPPPQAIRIALGGVDDRRALERSLRTLTRILMAPPRPPVHGGR
jgi:DNA-binding transcriptional MocR family regulator